MPDDRAPQQNCNEATEALIAADQLITRLQDKVAEQLPPDSGIPPERAYGKVIEELETAPEIDQVREALDRDTQAFGSPGRDQPPPPDEPPLEDRLYAANLAGEGQ
jgi:hypothetical protein